MQVERQHVCTFYYVRKSVIRGINDGEWRTGEEYVGICLVEGDNPGKLGLIPHKTERWK